MKRIKKRIITGSSLIMLLSLFSMLALILYPSNLFAKRIAYRNFTLYANQPLAGSYRPILDHALALAGESELFDADYLYDIYLTEGTLYKDVAAAIFGPAMARSQDNNILLNTNVNFDNDRLSSPSNWRNLTQTIAHEMIHCLQVHRYGVWSVNPVHHPPFWKMEGYPEYIALQEVIQSPEYNFCATIQRLKMYVDNQMEWPELEPGRSEHIVYLKGRVMIEYLMNIRGMTYDQILQDNRNEEAVYQELIAWYNTASIVP
jgi:hypothetical protein